jgi:hypothetical protein
MSKELIPYVILEAHPDWKRPYVLPEFGMIQEDKLKEHLLEKLVEFVYDRIDIENLNNIHDITNFWEHYYDDYYMDNSPWEATAIIDGIWDNVTPSYEDQFNALIKEKNKCYISSDENENDNDIESVKSSETVESIIIDNDENELSSELAMELIFNT